MQTNLFFFRNPTQSQAVLTFSCACFVVDATKFTGVCVLSPTHFCPTAICPPVILFKRGLTKLSRTSASKQTKKAPLSGTKISFLFICDILRFTSSWILSRFLLVFFLYWSLTLIFLLMTLMIRSQIALIVCAFKCFINSFFIYFGRNM